MIEDSNALGFCEELSYKFLTGTDCFFQIQAQDKYNAKTPISEITELYYVRIYFRNNTALETGATLYGSYIDNCSLRLLSNTFRICQCSISRECLTT